MVVLRNMKWAQFLYFLMLYNVTTNPVPKKCVVQGFQENRAVRLLQEYVQIDTSKEENIKRAVEFWKRLATDVGLPISVYTPTTKPICVITWYGSNPTLPSIILNSHMDVVPVEERDWKYGPFSGYIDSEGNMFGRGTQDTKAVGIQYIEAIRKMKEDNVTVKRTVHITVMPDEETGGMNGMVPFAKTEDFKRLNAGFALDEGMSSTDGTLYVTYQDKRPWQIKFTFHGEGGHGSSTVSDSAIEKVQKLIDISMEFKNQQLKLKESTNTEDYGAYTTLNINIIHGGIAANVIPSRITVVIDMRLAVSTTLKDMDYMIHSWLAKISNNTEIDFIRRGEVSEATRLDSCNPYWVAFEEALSGMNLTVKPIVAPATSDMLVLRNMGIPAIGFAYRPYTVSRAHAADEYLNMKTFLRGVEVYVETIRNLGNC